MPNRTIKTRLRFNFAIVVLFCSFVFHFRVLPSLFCLLFAICGVSFKCPLLYCIVVVFVVVLIS